MGYPISVSFKWQDVEDAYSRKCTSVGDCVLVVPVGISVAARWWLPKGILPFTREGEEVAPIGGVTLVGRTAGRPLPEAEINLCSTWCNTFSLLEKRTNLTYQGVTDLVTSSLYFSFMNWYSLGRGFFYSNSADAFGQVSIVSHFYHTWFIGFLGVVSSSLWVVWPRDQELHIIWYQRLAPLIKLYPYVKFIFFSYFTLNLLVSIHVFILGQFSLVLNVFLLSLLSLAFVLGSVIRKKDWSNFLFSD